MGRASVVRAETKARTDSAKNNVYTRFAKKLIMAVKAGGPDPAVNRLLAQLISDAKDANVPKDIIQRNVERGAERQSADYRETLFEFFGHGGVGLLVRTLSDNDNRASKDVHLVAKKNLLKPATVNAVNFKFFRRSRLDVNTLLEEDDLLDLCLQLGIDYFDLRTTVNGCRLHPSCENSTSVYVDPQHMAALRDALRSRGLQVETKLASIPKEGFISVSEEDFNANIAAIHAFEDLEDVDEVEHNMDLRSEHLGI